MGLLSKDIKSLDDLLQQALGEALYAERRIAGTVPGLIAKASDLHLKAELGIMLDASAANLERLEQVFRLHDLAPRAMECPAIDGIFIGADEINAEIDDAGVLDTAIAAAVQTVGTYSGARYTTLIAWLLQLGRREGARHLHKNLVASQRSSDALRLLAERRLNNRAHGSAETHSLLAS